MAPSLHLSLLGRFSATLDGQPVEGLRTTKAQALLAYLAAYRHPHRRHALAGLLWGHEADEDAKNNLRVTLANLNQLLPHHLESTRPTIALRGDQPVWLDLDEFQGKTASLVADAPDIPALQATAALYRGDFLEDLYVANAPAFEEWLLAERERWRRTLLDVLETLAETLLAERRYTEAVATLQRLLSLEPWSEAGIGN